MSIDLSLASHTNAGKTTLARTLLRRDVGEVRDEAHVTEVAEAHTLFETGEGDALVLWDMPGFGDSVRLLRRLRQSGNPIGWMLSQLWDRYIDRPFWCSQQAVRNMRDESDLVLYVANAGENPRVAGYVDAEMHILGWIGKPTIVLLNQLGAPREREHDEAEASEWQRYLADHPIVQAVLPFDAFARCWVQEDTLLAHIEAALPGEKRPAFARLRAVWCSRNLEVFERSMDVLARQLAAATLDHESIEQRPLADRARSWLGRLACGAQPTAPELERPMRALSGRLDAAVRTATDELIRLHGLSGRAGAEILARMGSQFAVSRAADPGRAGLIGGIASGALTGLAADLAAGGLTFGAGAIIGGVLGALSAGGLTHAYNLVRGLEQSSVSWSSDFLRARLIAALVRYLAVAHFGRGRGEFVAGEAPEHWRRAIEASVTAAGTELDGMFRTGAPSHPAGDTRSAAEITAALRLLLRRLAVEVLAALYPAAGVLQRDCGGVPSKELRSP